MASQADRNDRRAALVLLAAGLLGLLVLVAGGLEFGLASASQRQSGLSARLDGFYVIDPDRGELSGAPATDFTVDDLIAARVDWSALPGDTEVSAEWWAASGSQLWSEGRRAAAQMPGLIPFGHDSHDAGTYVFVVERWEGGSAVEVLARGRVNIS